MYIFKECEEDELRILMMNRERWKEIASSGRVTKVSVIYLFL